MRFRENDDLRQVRKDPGSQNGNAPKDGNMASDGYETIDRADGGTPRRGTTPSVKGFGGMNFYRPNGR